MSKYLHKYLRSFKELTLHDNFVLVDVPVYNLSTPVFVMLRTPPTTLYEVMPFTPVWWDPTLNNSTGGWSPDGCEFRHELQDHVVFSCINFGYYGLIQDVTHLQTAQAKFKLSHPAIYIGTFILFTSFLVVILTYLLCYATIQVSVTNNSRLSDGL